MFQDKNGKSIVDGDIIEFDNDEVSYVVGCAPSGMRAYAIAGRVVNSRMDFADVTLYQNHKGVHCSEGYLRRCYVVDHDGTTEEQELNVGDLFVANGVLYKCERQGNDVVVKRNDDGQFSVVVDTDNTSFDSIKKVSVDEATKIVLAEKVNKVTSPGSAGVVAFAAIQQSQKSEQKMSDKPAVNSLTDLGKEFLSAAWEGSKDGASASVAHAITAFILRKVKVDLPAVFQKDGVLYDLPPMVVCFVLAGLTLLPIFPQEYAAQVRPICLRAARGAATMLAGSVAIREFLSDLSTQIVGLAAMNKMNLDGNDKT